MAVKNASRNRMRMLVLSACPPCHSGTKSRAQGKKKNKTRSKSGGGGARSHDLLHAKQTLYHLATPPR
eukprot:scaffold25482_cov165-Isochrysis_galbana.AAC.3